MMTALVLNNTVNKTEYNFLCVAVTIFAIAVVRRQSRFLVQPVKSGNLMTEITLLLFAIMVCTSLPKGERGMSKGIHDETASKLKTVNILGPKAYSQS